MAALEQWPAEGIPENPGAWLMATAKHRAIDRIRHGRWPTASARRSQHEMDVVRRRRTWTRRPTTTSATTC